MKKLPELPIIKPLREFSPFLKKVPRLLEVLCRLKIGEEIARIHLGRKEASEWKKFWNVYLYQHCSTKNLKTPLKCSTMRTS
jgi:hypothetical protein